MSKSIRIIVGKNENLVTTDFSTEKTIYLLERVKFDILSQNEKAEHRQIGHLPEALKKRILKERIKKIDE